MIENQILRRICNELAYRPIEWSRIVKRVKAIKDNPDNAMWTNERNFSHMFAVTHLRTSLEDIAATVEAESLRNKKDPEAVTPEVLIFTGPYDDTHNNCTFKSTSSGVVLAKEENDSKVIPYDALCFAGEVLSVFRVYSSAHKNTWPRLKTTAYTPQLRAARALAGGDIGYVVLVPRDFYEAKTTPESIRSQFEKDGGIIIPLHETRELFRSNVDSAVIRYGL